MFARRVKAFRQMPRSDKVLLIRMVPTYGFVSLMYRTVSLPRLSRLLGIRIAEPATGEERALGKDLPPEVWQAARAAALLSRTGSEKGRCLKQSLVAGHHLRSHAPVLQIGVVGSLGEYSAHAWLEIDGRSTEDVSDFKVLSPPNSPQPNA